MLRIFATRLHPLIAIALLSILLPPVVAIDARPSLSLAQNSGANSAPTATEADDAPSDPPSAEDSEATATNTITIAASPSMAVMSRTLKARFEAQPNTNTEIIIESMDTDAALQQVTTGEADLAAIGRPLTETELAQGWQEVLISREKIAIIVSADNPFQGELTFNQFADIFRGDITNWSSLGGPTAGIRFIDRPTDSDTRVSLSNYTIFKSAPFETGNNAVTLDSDDTAALVRELGTDGIGYAIASQVMGQTEIRVVPMDGVMPDSDLYPYSQPRIFVYRGQIPTPLQDFIDFSTDGLGQTAVAQAQATESADVAVAEIPRGKVAVSPDGDRLVSTHEDGTLQFWDAAGNAIGDPVEAHSGTITDATFDDPGETLITTGVDGTVRQWDPDIGESVGPTISPEGGPASAIAISPDGQTLVTASTDGTLQFWDGDGNAQGDPVQAHPGLITTLAFSPDGETVASGGEDGTVTFWSPAGQSKGDAYAGHTGPVTDVAFSPDSQRLASTGTDGQLRFWGGEGGVFGEPILAHEGGANAIAFNSQDGTLATTGADNTVKLWDPEGELLATPVDDLDQPASSLAFSPNGDRLIIGDPSGEPKQWDLDGNPLLPGDVADMDDAESEGIDAAPDPDPATTTDPLAEVSAFFQSLPAWARWGLLPLLGLALIIGAALRGGDDRQSTTADESPAGAIDPADVEGQTDKPNPAMAVDPPLVDPGDGQSPTPALVADPEVADLGTRLNDAKAALVQGVELAKTGQFEAALVEVHRAIEVADIERMKAIATGASASGALALLVGGLTQRSKLFSQLGRNSDALSSLDTALLFDPNNDEAIALKGKLLAGGSSVERANILFDQARNIYNTPDMAAPPPDDDDAQSPEGEASDPSQQDIAIDPDDDSDTTAPINTETQVDPGATVDTPDDSGDVPPTLLAEIADLSPTAQTPPWITMDAEPDEVLAKATADDEAINPTEGIPPELAAEFAAIPDEEQPSTTDMHSDIKGSGVIAAGDEAGNVNAAITIDNPDQVADWHENLDAAVTLDSPEQDAIDRAVDNASDQNSAAALGTAAVVDSPESEDVDQMSSASPTPLDWPDTHQADNSEDIPAELQAALQDIPADPQTLPWVNMVSDPAAGGNAIAAASNTILTPTATKPVLIEKNQITLAPCNTQWAYVSWSLGQKHRDALEQQPEAQLALRLYDVTESGEDYTQGRDFQQHECYDLAREWYLSIPRLDRDYLVELGYFNADKRWQPLIHSEVVHFPK